jgi:hypothetical protein
MATDDDEEFFGLFDDAEDFDISAAAVAAAATVGVPDTTSAIQEMMNSSEDLFVLRISQTHDFKTNVCATGPRHSSFCHAFC